MPVQYPQFQPPGQPRAGSPQMSSIINNAIPNFGGLSQNASGIVGNMMGGLPSSGPAKTKAAYFGATSGMPNSGVSNALGYDLYREDADKYQQQGFDNFLNLIQGYSGTIMPTTGQQIQNNQYQQDFTDRRRQEELARQDAENARLTAARPRQPNGIYRIPGQIGAVPGGSNLPWRRNL